MALAAVSALSGCIPAGAGDDSAWPRYRPDAAAPPTPSDTGAVAPGPSLSPTLAAPGDSYIVQPGDSGLAIAQHLGVPWHEFVALNGLTEPYILRVGQRLRVPSRATVPPATGDPLTARARAFHIDIDDLATGAQPALAAGERPDRAGNHPDSAHAARAVAVPLHFANSFAWPADGRITARFGSRGGGVINDGIDIAVRGDGAVHAAARGVVIYASPAVAQYGGLVLVSHGDGWITAYSHLARLAVTRGQAVRAGQAVGMVDPASGDRLNFQIRKDRRPVDPLAHLPPRP